MEYEAEYEAEYEECEAKSDCGQEPAHQPVLLEEVIDLLKKNGSWNVGRRIADCTLGLGGYSEKILEVFPGVNVYGLDRDRAALALSRKRLEAYGDRFRALHMNFGNMEDVLAEFAPLDAFLFDLGVSNMQLTEAQRGFSFQHDGPLDMRMNPDGSAPTAAEVLERMSAAELSTIFRKYGEEHYSGRIASGIEEYRKRGGHLATTGELVALIRKILPAAVQRKMRSHPARRVFQALRIYINDELGELESALRSVEKLAAGGAVVIVVSYHSLEDRIVKYAFRMWDKGEGKGAVLTKHPLVPESGETAENYRARSAKLRAFRFA